MNFIVLIFEGYGWLTFNLLQAYIYANSNGNLCNIYIPFQCDPYVKLFVNGEKVFESPKKTETIYANDDITIETEKIPKASIIKLELWSSDRIFWSNDKLIFSSEGDIQSFLTQPFRKDAQNSTDIYSIETIETISFWRDEYQ